MIYCVVPQALADELYDRLVDYYKDDPNVDVIVDRRKGGHRDMGNQGVEESPPDDERRRRRLPGTFPKIGSEE